MTALSHFSQCASYEPDFIPEPEGVEWDQFVQSIPLAIAIVQAQHVIGTGQSQMKFNFGPAVWATGEAGFLFGELGCMKI